MSDDHMSVEPFYCLRCKGKFDCVSGATDEEAPKEGSLSMCIYCSNIAIFTEKDDGGFELREPSGEELRDIMADPYVNAALYALNKARETLAREN